jgi:hypothetical protein
MNAKAPIPFAPGSALHAESRSIGLTVAAMRKAQGKHNPNDFPIGSPEFEALEMEFLEDVLRFMGADPDEHCRFD